MSEEQKVAEQLRRTREQQGISLDDVRRKTGLSANVLHALEEGRFDVVEPVFLRLALRAYVQFLHLDPEETLGALEREYVSDEATQVPVAPPPPAPMTRPVPHASWGLRLSLAAVLVVAAAAAWVFVTRDREEEIDEDAEARVQLPLPPAARSAPAREEGRPVAAESETLGTRRGADSAGAVVVPGGQLTMPVRSDEAAPRPAPLSESFEPGSAALSTPPAAAAPETVPAAAAPAVSGSDSLVALSVEARDSTWVQVMAGGRTLFEGILAPGNRRTWQNPEALVVHAGRARGLRYWLQGQPVPDGRLGEPNRVLRFRATREGITLLNPAPQAAARDTNGIRPADPPR